MNRSNYDKYPFVQVEAENRSCVTGWSSICQALNQEIKALEKRIRLVVIECYQGVDNTELASGLQKGLQHQLWINSADAFKGEDIIRAMVYPDVTDDRIFGYLSRLKMEDFLDAEKVQQQRQKANKLHEGTVVVCGPGASLVLPDYDLLIYADMARWEIQMRMRRNSVNNLGVTNKDDGFAAQYKQGFFVDWRVCDRLKKELMYKWNFVLDTNTSNSPKLVRGEAILKGLALAASRPFRVVPFFDPGPWGGQWMKEVCDLDRSEVNFAWCFDCVPEENSLLLGFGDVKVEIPAINLVFNQTDNLLGPKVHARFGDEFPIRFDFLDTMEGGNLSLQVHPTTEYIQQAFGMHYTQDESYYMLDVAEGAYVYLGLQEGVNPEAMIGELKEAQQTGKDFNAEKHVKKWPVQKHDHVSIPAGTVHCSGAGSMVLEISATPYIFTFKLWDWGRLGLDGQPRPINIEHGEKVIQWDRTASWVEKNALNLVEPLQEGEGWREERTGLNELEFIETRRHWFTGKVPHHTRGIVNVLNLVEGREAIVESPTGAFAPFIVHYAETFIVPAAVGAYTIRPYGEAEGARCATIKAYVRI
ncbi:class I mannose-6-phosphate isomerase [Cesiribacter sp. SM1]|uniref:class I mannose-6-phosphate isomerase n=1 Tax=Cesiribacter sp. SM1 TaxID=2861196 RepID=UPI001CD79FA7|nr:class I mannose-6-phosphate isomerase [Cesiribacter sp. SM1]